MDKYTFHEPPYVDSHVHVAGLLELRVHVLLDILPNSIAVRSKAQKALDAGVVHQLRLQADIRIPLGERCV